MFTLTRLFSTFLSLTIGLFISTTSTAGVKGTLQNIQGKSPMDIATRIRITDDNGSLIAGHRLADAAAGQDVRTDLDAFAMHQDAAGNTLWHYTYGGSHDEVLNDLLLTADGGALLVGGSRSADGAFARNRGHFDYWITKIDAHGIAQWTTTLGSSLADIAYAAAPTEDNGYLIAGSAYYSDGDVQTHYGNADCWLVKLDSEGNLVWQKTLGGGMEETPKTLQQAADGNYIMTATTLSQNGDVAGNNGSYDIWTVKLDAEANILWQVCSGGTGVDRISAAQTTADGGCIIAGHSMALNGHFDSSPCHQDIWVIKLDSHGIVEWERTLGGSADEEAVALVTTADGGYLLAAQTTSNDGAVTALRGTQDGWLVKLSPSGSALWDTCLGNRSINYARDMQLTADGGICLLGNSISGQAGIEMWVARWNSSTEQLLGENTSNTPLPTAITPEAVGVN